jgi:hypothetical protein
MIYFAAFCLDKTRFIVKEAYVPPNTKNKKQSKPAKPIYRVMSVSDIRRIYIPHTETVDPKTGKKLKVGTERRRHKHWFRDKRFVNVRGTYKWYESTWVGPKEVMVDDRLIQVLTDIG